MYIFGLLYGFAGLGGFGWPRWSGAGIKWDLGFHRGVGFHPGLTALVLPTVTTPPGCTAPGKSKEGGEL